MKVLEKYLSFLFLVILLMGFSSPAASQATAPSQIKAEISRLQKSLKDTPIADKNFAEVPSMVDGTLKTAIEAVNSGQLYLALEKLGQAESLLQGVKRAADKAEVEKGGFPVFESQWNAVSLHLTALDNDAHNK